MPVRRILKFVSVAASLLGVSAGAAQTPATIPRLPVGLCVDPGAIRPSVIEVGTFADDRRRIAQLLGRCSTDGELIRSARSITTPLAVYDSARLVRWAVTPPNVSVTHNSALPFSFNDGPQWAGRGFTTSLSAGVRVETDYVSFSVTPDLVYQQNRVFQVLASPLLTRSSYASPWYWGVASIDLPSRFGDRSETILYLGSTWLDLRAGPVAFGFSSDEQWWGPSIRNALVMSNNAPGIPQLYLRSRQPLSTPVGDVEFRWLLGGLTESLYFDTLSKNDHRALSAAILTLRAAVDRGLTIGIARAVYAPIFAGTDARFHVLDVFTRWHQNPDTLVETPDRPADQLLSLFGRWVFPTVGFEVYAEWAKLFPPGLRELFVNPQTHQGYTVGLQWVNRLSSVTAFRLQAEATMLEQTPSIARSTLASFYTSRLIPQGYTQRGQVIGAAIGPGASSQFLAGDYLAAHWRAGLEVGRIRWNEDVYYRTPNGLGFFAHDVSLFAGLRGGTAYRGYDIDLEAIAQKRLNYLFQSARSGYTTDRAFDVGNFTFRLRLSPR